MYADYLSFQLHCWPSPDESSPPAKPSPLISTPELLRFQPLAKLIAAAHKCVCTPGCCSDARVTSPYTTYLCHQRVFLEFWMCQNVPAAVSTLCCISTTDIRLIMVFLWPHYCLCLRWSVVHIHKTVHVLTVTTQAYNLMQVIIQPCTHNDADSHGIMAMKLPWPTCLHWQHGFSLLSICNCMCLCTVLHCLSE